MEKAFYFKCKVCGAILKDGDEIVVTSIGMVSGNTPVIFTSEYQHKECPKSDKPAEGWSTGYDSYD